MSQIDEVVTEDIGFTVAGAEHGFRLFDKPVDETSIAGKYTSLLAIGNARGYLAASNGSLLILSSLEKIDSAAKENQSIETVQLPTSFPLEITQVAFDVSNDTLAVVLGGSIYILKTDAYFSANDATIALHPIAWKEDTVVSIEPCPYLNGTWLVLYESRALHLLNDKCSTEIAQNVTACAFNKSSFVYTTNQSLVVYRDDKLPVFDAAGVDLSWAAGKKCHIIYIQEIKSSAAWFAVMATEDKEDLMAFVVDISKGVNAPQYLEAEIADPWSDADRFPNYYTASLSNWLPGKCLLFATTAKSSEIGTIQINPDSGAIATLVQADDSQRALFPLVDDDDSFPLGMAIDVHLKSETVYDPCPGVSEVTGKLPRVIVLLALGDLVSWWVFDKKALINDTVSLENAAQEYAAVAATTKALDDPSPQSATGDENRSSLSKISAGKNPFNSGGLNENPFGTSTTAAFAQASSASTLAGTDSFYEPLKTASVPPPLSAEPNATESKAAFGSSGFGSNTLGNPSPASAGFGNSSFGAAAFGSSSFGSASFGQSAFGAIKKSPATSAAPPVSGFGSYASAAAPSFGSSSMKNTSSPFASLKQSGELDATKPSSPFGATNASSPFASLKQSGELDATKTSSPFGATNASSPFASLKQSGELDATKPSSPFDATKASSPFASLKQSGELDATKTSSPFGATNVSSPFASLKQSGELDATKTSSPFGATNASSPFASLKQSGELDATKTSSPFGATNASSPFASLKQSGELDATKPSSPFDATKASSPFASLKQSGELDATKTSSPFGATNVSSPFASLKQSGELDATKTSSPFGATNASSPFASLKQSGELDATKTSSPFGATNASSPFASLKQSGELDATKSSSSSDARSTRFSSATEPTADPSPPFATPFSKLNDRGLADSEKENSVAKIASLPSIASHSTPFESNSFMGTQNDLSRITEEQDGSSRSQVDASRDDCLVISSNLSENENSYDSAGESFDGDASLDGSDKEVSFAAPPLVKLVKTADLQDLSKAHSSSRNRTEARVNPEAAPALKSELKPANFSGKINKAQVSTTKTGSGQSLLIPSYTIVQSPSLCNRQSLVTAAEEIDFLLHVQPPQIGPLLTFGGLILAGKEEQRVPDIPRHINIIVEETDANLLTLMHNAACIQELFDFHRQSDPIQFRSKESLLVPDKWRLSHLKDAQKLYYQLREASDKTIGPLTEASKGAQELVDQIKQYQQDIQRINKMFSQLRHHRENVASAVLKRRPLDLQTELMRDRVRQKYQRALDLEKQLRAMMMPIKAKKNFKPKSAKDFNRIVFDIDRRARAHQFRLGKLLNEIALLDLEDTESADAELVLAHHSYSLANRLLFAKAAQNVKPTPRHIDTDQPLTI